MTFTVFTKPGCTYCDRAKNLLNEKAIAFTMVTLDVGQDNPDEKDLMPLAEFKELFPTVKTLPHILENGIAVGGYRELAAKLSVR
jgi:glutaredoxin